LTLYSWKLTLGGTDVENSKAIEIENIRPENNISSLTFTINDYKSTSYADLVDTFTAAELSLKQVGGSYTKVFSGKIYDVHPSIGRTGETLEVAAWGNEYALCKTHCNTSYGAESANPTLHHPQGIIQDILDNYVEKTFGGAATNWTITGTKVENVHSDFEVTNLDSQYLDNFTLLNRLCDLTSSHAALASEISIHWFVDTAGNLYVKGIQSTSSDSAWQRYYGGSQAAATVVVGTDELNRGFRKHINDYAQRIILSSAFRKPAFDIWCEDGGPTWGTVDCTATYSNTEYIVGSHSLKLEPNNAPNPAIAYYPSTRDAAWDFTKCGSPVTIPRISFYVRASDVNCFGYPIYLFTDSIACGGANNYYFWAQLDEYMTPRADKWIYISLPIGPYYALDPALQKDDGSDEFEWNVVGGVNADWSNINGIALFAGVNNGWDKFFDDIHFSGRVIRDCYDASEITATKPEMQVFLRMDTALDDTLNTTANTGTAARVAHAELLRRAQQPIVGTYTMPLKHTLLPGQTLHVHSGLKSDSTYRFNQDMRVKQVRHNIRASGYTTTVDLTSDVSNSHAPGVTDMWSLITEHAGALNQGQAKDLKSAGVDNLITRLSWDPT